MVQLLLQELFEECKKYSEILPPVEVIHQFESIYQKHSHIQREEWGCDSSGRAILSYSIENGSDSIFLYAFPDPGEAVGGTAILCLINLLLDKATALSQLPYRWIFIPCMNFVDQPNDGLANAKVMKTVFQEIDWCVDNPRPETTAILEIANKYKPIFSFPLHDEYHNERYVAPYIGIAKTIQKTAALDVRNLFEALQMDMNPKYSDDELGDGFFQMSSIGEEYFNSTFYHLSLFGQVIVVEMPNNPNVANSILLYLQLAAGIQILLELIQDKQEF